ncbi:dual specificity protein phosphatase 12 [Trichodelitschia bisporula]|uniref:protein-tyrosine-phosphatase n=1 Tax=Trichodelitschia bisporula TaxID=703511 RepID=A0A6G1HSX6_9PEZI|nr:dual specificity protein phosphatase 12 [Trichodelitschia bisporula]
MLLDKVPGDLKLYIGGLFTLRRKEQMQEANITHVLSVLRQPLDKKLFESYKHMHVEVDDVEDENLLEHFAATNAFVQEGLDGGGGVFVHCAMGKSRSATCVLAYLIHKYGITPSEALAQVRQSRPLVEPNEGFWQQLELYHQMNMPTDIDSHPVYQRWLYQRQVQMSAECGQAPEIENIRFEDEHVSPDSPETAEFELKCKKCRRKLATSTHLIPHTPPPHNAPFPQTLTCAHYFLDPLSWMRSELEHARLEGRLECPQPKCGAQVGKYAWQGMRCSCGAWVVPAITLARGRVDEVRSKGAVEGKIRRGPGVGMPATSATGRGLL